MNNTSELYVTRKAVSKGKEWLYEVFQDGVQIGKRKTSRDYYAVAVYPKGSTYRSWIHNTTPGSNEPAKPIEKVREEAYVAGWIGRPDLIPGHVDIKNGAKPAILKVEYRDLILPYHER